MIWNTLPNDERLHLWKKLRDDIVDLPLQDKLVNISKFCADMPVGSRTLDYYTPLEWPTPWEILCRGSFCTSSVSLLMFYTLTLLHSTTDVELMLVQYGHEIHLLPIINDQFVLNFEHGTVNNYSEVMDNFVVLQKYTKAQTKKIT